MSRDIKVHIDTNEDGEEAIFLCGGGDPIVDASVLIPVRQFGKFQPHTVTCKICLAMYHEELARRNFSGA